MRARTTKKTRPLSLVEFASKYLLAEQPDGRLTPLTPGCDFHRWLCGELEAVSELSSDTDDQAKDFLRKIRDQLESNAALQRDFPAVAGVGPVWQAHYLRCRNGVGIRAISTGGKIRGRTEKESRPSLIVLDDPQNIDHVTSAVKRERSWDWLVKDVCSAGSPRTNIVVLGTALHREAIVCRLQITPGWRSKVFRSIIEWPQRMELWKEWETILFDHDDDEREQKARTFYEANREAMEE